MFPVVTMVNDRALVGLNSFDADLQSIIMPNRALHLYDVAFLPHYAKSYSGGRHRSKAYSTTVMGKLAVDRNYQQVRSIRTERQSSVRPRHYLSSSPKRKCHTLMLEI